ncbi:MAG: ABC transporter permease, partial [Acidobacteriota bacterium]
MLLSVGEHTHEIGVCKAIGATTRRILLQIFAESMSLTFLAGLAGLIFGRGLCALINVMGTMRDIRYNSVLVFQPVSGRMEAASIRQVRQVLGEIHKFNPADEKALIWDRFSEGFA